MSSGNVLCMPFDEADKVIRRRAEQAAKGAVKAARPRGNAPLIAHWDKAFRAVIMFYESNGDQGMADLLRLDMERFTRRNEARKMLIRPEERTA